jgi:hypothetical protein
MTSEYTDCLVGRVNEPARRNADAAAAGFCFGSATITAASDSVSIVAVLRLLLVRPEFWLAVVRENTFHHNIMSEERYVLPCVRVKAKEGSFDTREYSSRSDKSRFVLYCMLNVGTSIHECWRVERKKPRRNFRNYKQTRAKMSHYCFMLDTPRTRFRFAK